MEKIIKAAVERGASDLHIKAAELSADEAADRILAFLKERGMISAV